MRVLFLSPAAELGGAERCLLDCVAALMEQGGVQVYVVALAEGPLLGKARQLGARTQVIQAPRNLTLLGESGSLSDSRSGLVGLVAAAPGIMSFLAQLRRAIVRAGPNIIHSNGVKAHLLAGLLAPPRVRIVVHLHDFVSARRWSSRLLPAIRQVRRSATFIANSRAVARDFISLAPDADVRTIYNVVDTDYFREGVAEPVWLASLSGLNPPEVGTTAFGLVATYARWKGHELFIKAAELLSKAQPKTPVRFYVVGGPIYETVGSQVRAPELLRQARDAGVQSHFGLVPFQDDIARVYRSLDVVVHASTRPEPFGRTIIEAMACGRPVIVSRDGGAAELFDEEINALGFGPGNAAELAKTMMRGLDPDLRARLGRAARQHAATGFARRRLAAELLGVYAP